MKFGLTGSFFAGMVRQDRKLQGAFVESDEKLIERINRGEVDAFETLYVRYRDWVHRLAYRFTRDEELAQDVVQETFTYLLKKFPGFQLTARMTTFLYPTVKFTALGMLRQRQRHAGVDSSPEEIAVPAPEQTDASRSELAAAIAVLSDAHRETMLMRFVDGFSIDQIAAVLDIPAGTVKSRLHKALQKLRENESTRRYFLD
ncbi:MAG: sigma-70 family RNA polymerase sigma factor [Planctomycetota bacterium]